MLLQKVFYPISRHKTKKEMSSVVFICLQEGITSKVFLSQYRSSVRTVHLILARFFLVALLTLFPNFFFFLLLYSITETSFRPCFFFFYLLLKTALWKNTVQDVKIGFTSLNFVDGRRKETNKKLRSMVQSGSNFCKLQTNL